MFIKCNQKLVWASLSGLSALKPYLQVVFQVDLNLRYNESHQRPVRNVNSFRDMRYRDKARKIPTGIGPRFFVVR